MAMVSAEVPKIWLDQFNRQYFNGSLSRWKLVLSDIFHPDHINILGRCEPKSKTIYMKEFSNSDRKKAKGTLLHEMIHARIGQYHGEKFNRELQRLISLGAPVTEEVLVEPRRPNAKELRKLIDYYLLEGVEIEEAQEVYGRDFDLSRIGIVRMFPSASKGSGSVEFLRKRQRLSFYDNYQACKMAVSLRRQHISFRGIAAELNNAGLKTISGRSYSPSAVRYLLNS